MHCKSKGFTLIEVLVASLILFLVITTMMSVYRGAMLSSTKAQASLDFSIQLPQIRPLITDSLRGINQPRAINDSGLSGSVRYAWTATPVAKGRSSHPDNVEFDKVATSFLRGSTIVYLWEVKLTLQIDEREQFYEFMEVSW